MQKARFGLPTGTKTLQRKALHWESVTGHSFFDVKDLAWSSLNRDTIWKPFEILKEGVQCTPLR